MMDAIMAVLTALSWALWWWLFAWARRIEREDKDAAYRESVRLSGEGIER